MYAHIQRWPVEIQTAAPWNLSPVIAQQYSSTIRSIAVSLPQGVFRRALQKCCELGLKFCTLQWRKWGTVCFVLNPDL